MICIGKTKRTSEKGLLKIASYKSKVTIFLKNYNLCQKSMGHLVIIFLDSCHLKPVNSPPIPQFKADLMGQSDAP